MFDRFCEKFLPVYLRFWPTNYWLAIWSAPVRCKGVENVLPDRKDTAWQALRITIRRGECHEHLVLTIKQGVI